MIPQLTRWYRAPLAPSPQGTGRGVLVGRRTQPCRRRTSPAMAQSITMQHRMLGIMYQCDDMRPPGTSASAGRVGHFEGLVLGLIQCLFEQRHSEVQVLTLLARALAESRSCVGLCGCERKGTMLLSKEVPLASIFGRCDVTILSCQWITRQAVSDAVTGRPLRADRLSASFQRESRDARLSVA